MTKQAVADFLGISQNYYTYIENGERQKSLDLVYVSKLAELFNVSVDWIAKQEQKVKTKQEVKSSGALRIRRQDNILTYKYYIGRGDY